MLSNILTGYLIITILFCFLRLRVGLTLFLIYIIIVPFVNFLNFGANLLNMLLIAAVFFRFKIKSIDVTPFKPFIFLYIAQLVMIPFHDSVSHEYQLHVLRSDFMGTLFLPFAIHNVMQNVKSSVNSFSSTLFAIIIVAAGYSLLLTLTVGFNPYITVIMPLNGQEFREGLALANDDRIFGRISGVFAHPMKNGLFLALSSIFIISKINSKKLSSQKLLLFLLSAVLITTLLIGVRSAIAALGISVAFFFLIEKKAKLNFATLAGLLCIVLVIVSIPGLSDYTNSIVDSESSKVKGSSLEMRVQQFDGCMKEIQSNPAFGNGYAWTNYYRENVGLHPTMLAFESLLIVVLSNSGFVGLIVWIIMLFIYYRLIRNKLDSTKFHLLLTLMVLYITFSLITGEYGYLKYFMIFYVIIWNSNLKYFESRKIN